MKKEQEKFERALSIAESFVDRRKYKGFDPYDILNSPLPLKKMGKWPGAVLIQIQKRSPIDLHPLLGIKADYNPKGIALLLEAACKRASYSNSEGPVQTAKELFRILMDLRTSGYSGDCWGYNFPWANPAKYLPSWSPTIVVTGFVSKALHAYHTLTGSKEALRSLKRIDSFILEDLPRTESRTGICFSYSTHAKDMCYNASLLAAEHFARLHDITRDPSYGEWIEKTVDFVLDKQHPDGHWNYSMDPDTNEERKQIDFHQGFIIDSLKEVHDHFDPSNNKLEKALEKGCEFYRKEQFFPNGRAMWRLPKKWPMDIHNQAQGIITFSRTKELHKDHLPLAKTIANWTIDQMQKKNGGFIYRITPLFKNRITYMRWGQAWMVLALTELLKALKEE